MKHKNGKKEFPGKDPGCDPVQRKYGDSAGASTHPSWGGGVQGAGLGSVPSVPKSGISK